VNSRNFIKTSGLSLASKTLIVGELLDWFENAYPKKWKLNGQICNFDWD